MAVEVLSAMGYLIKCMRPLPGCQIHEFGGIEPNPSYETLMKAVAYARYHGITHFTGCRRRLCC